jgi:hypothetical protein
MSREKSEFASAADTKSRQDFGVVWSAIFELIQLIKNTTKKLRHLIFNMHVGCKVDIMCGHMLANMATTKIDLTQYWQYFYLTAWIKKHMNQEYIAKFYISQRKR